MTLQDRIDLETKVIERFITKSKRERYLEFIKSDKNRRKFTNDLSNVGFLVIELFDRVDKNKYDLIKERIKALGNIKDCYVISENSQVDKKRLDIETAMQEAIGRDMGTILVFGDADVIYSEAEGFNNRWISKPFKNLPHII